MNVMRRDSHDRLRLGWQEWSGLCAVAIVPASMLIAAFYSFSIGLEGRLTKIEVNGFNTVTAIEKLDVKSDRIQAMNAEIDVLEAKLEMLTERLNRAGAQP